MSKENIALTPKQLLVSLRASVDEYDYVAVRELCDGLIHHLRTRDTEYPKSVAVEILKTLIRKRRFALVREIADVLMQSGSTANEIKKLYAQALIDEGNLIAAIDVLRELEEVVIASKDDHELIEVRGLLGRAYKQIYINGAEGALGAQSGQGVQGVQGAESAEGVQGAQGAQGRALGQAMLKAVEMYSCELPEGFNNRMWYDVNLLALASRAERDGLMVDKIDTDAIAQSIVDTAEAAERALSPADDGYVEPGDRMWLWASAIEAHIALGQYNDAYKCAVRYVGFDAESDSSSAEKGNADSFALASTLRQFREVWQLDENDGQQFAILEVLRSSLLASDGGSIVVHDLALERNTLAQMLDPQPQSTGSAGIKFEKVLGTEGVKSLRWLQNGLNRAQFVCRLVDKDGVGFGTGFLVRAADLALPDGPEWVVITNSHCVSSDPMEQALKPAAEAPHKTLLEFEMDNNRGRQYAVSEVLYYSPRHKLDYAVLLLTDTIDVTNNYSIERELPASDSEQRIYVIGHPLGGHLSFSLYDNLLLDHELPKLHYRSPTQEGSSGSPVFNEYWDLIGLHHGGNTRLRKLNGKDGRYPANEGIAIASIIDDIALQVASG